VVPLPPFRDIKDPDEKRREIVWIAISFIVILATWLAVVLIFGYQPLMMGMSYDEVVLLTGLGLLVFCTILYLGAREREQRAANKALVAQLRGAVSSLDQRLEQLNGLCFASAELAGSLDLDHIAHAVLESVVTAAEAETSYLFLVEVETGRPVYARSSPSQSTGGDASLDPEMGWSELLSGASGDAEEMLAKVEPWNRHRTVIRAPMRLTKKLVGVLGARRGEGGPRFVSDDLRLLTILANMAAKAMESAQLHAELRESYLATVRSLVNSLHARDNYTASHGERVTALAIRMAEYLGLEESMIRDIEIFGPLHDVGKIGIRDSVLMKPAPLSEDERAVCREHCLIGERILQPLRPGLHALGMVRNHHESWDGRGYPDGIAGERIPKLARLLQVADTFDAMITDRPYQAAMSEQEVLAHFRQYAGQKYDPVAVEALCAAVSDGARRPREAATAGGSWVRSIADETGGGAPGATGSPDARRFG
jgi:hypothetical protein